MFGLLFDQLDDPVLLDHEDLRVLLAGDGAVLELVHDAVLDVRHVAGEEHHALAFLGDFVLGQHVVCDADHA